ncbi:MAG: LCP family protein [Propionibacteriales bacterium]|nr:LCP family protein [Propionibacteriales bacterium]
MTQDERPGTAPGEPSPPGSRARRVSTSRAERRPAAARGARGRRKAPQPGKTVFRVILSSLLALGLATGVGVVLLYNNWNGNIQREDLAAQLGEDRPEKMASGPINILVMGDDTRSGEGNKIDGEGGGGSDTTIMFHLSADRKFAYGISVPRDTLVDRPDCFAKNGKVIAGQQDAMWNAAYSVGGPACTIRQFEQLTRVRIDNYVVVDFNGFRDMVNALGGVEVCIPEDIVDETSGITLRAGTREIKGREALSYVRVRKGVVGGDGTDPQRIKRQQAFMASMIGKAVGADTLAQPIKLTKFINAATSSLKTDFKNIAELADIAASFNGIGLDNISFVTTPWVYSTRQPGRVEWTAEVNKLWRLARNDKRLSAEFLDDSISAGQKTDGSSTSGSTGGPKSSDATDGASSPGSGATDESTEGSNGSPDEPASPGLC